jgi:adenosine kinase
MKIYVSGSLAYDRIMNFPGKFSDHILPDKIHVINVCFMVSGLIERFGGTAGNIAFNLAMLDEKPVILAAAGKDFASYRAWLKQMGLPLEGIREIPDEFTASAHITTDRSDNQITAFNPGAMNHPAPFSFDGMDPKDALAIISPGNLEDMVVLSRFFKEIGIAYIFDPGQATTALSAQQLTEMITGSKIFVSNDYEFELIRKATSMTAIDILERTGAIITTLGEKGSLLQLRGEKMEIPVVPAETVKDPTGAGDAYRAGLIKGIVLGKNLLEASRMGATCASFAVECQGTQIHRFSLESFWERFSRAFG